MLLPKHRNALVLRTIIHLKDKPLAYRRAHLRTLKHLNAQDPIAVELLDGLK